jgi:hypothetical protein
VLGELHQAESGYEWCYFHLYGCGVPVGRPRNCRYDRS